MTDPAELLVCGGPNGTGKTSLAREYASAKGIVYLGADEIAEMLSPGNAAHAKIEAGRRFLAAVNDHLSAGTSMVVETTLSGLAFRKVLSTAKSNGFEITIAYLFWIPQMLAWPELRNEFERAVTMYQRLTCDDVSREV